MSDHRPGYLPKIIAHRGASKRAPENTLAAIAEAATLGARAVEFDVTISADGVPVLMHDETLNRCSDGQGPVILKTLAELQALDAGGWFDVRFAGERIPTLEQALELAADRGFSVNLELKPTLGWEAPTVSAICDTLKNVWRADMALVVSSFNPLALEQFAAEMPGVDLGYLCDAVPPDWRARLARFGCVNLHCYAPFVTPDLVRDVRAHGARLHVFTVNDPDQAKDLFAWGVDAVFTDCPDVMLEALDDEG
ncbi:glycerophosphodiester phosphodiesterase family protein [Magnetovibrio sp.]|uniref:glycerophosphodiester phosphodiesterase family protein n=1 Tax=Magnetovibrio sp. TaxID=2024836 RepID=UPI002F92179A